MTNEEAVVILKNAIKKPNTEDGYLGQALTMAIKALQQRRWIPVSEPPKETGEYLVTTKWKGSYSGDVYIETNMAVYREKSKEWDCADVIAWMPLPEPFREENDKNDE